MNFSQNEWNSTKWNFLWGKKKLYGITLYEVIVQRNKPLNFSQNEWKLCGETLYETLWWNFVVKRCGETLWWNVVVKCCENFVKTLWNKIVLMALYKLKLPGIHTWSTLLGQIDHVFVSFYRVLPLKRGKEIHIFCNSGAPCQDIS